MEYGCIDGRWFVAEFTEYHSTHVVRGHHFALRETHCERIDGVAATDAPAFVVHGAVNLAHRCTTAPRQLLAKFAQGELVCSILFTAIYGIGPPKSHLRTAHGKG